MKNRISMQKSGLMLRPFFVLGMIVLPLLLGAARQSHALSITQNISFDFREAHSPFPSGRTSFLNVAPFDSSLGTLNFVDVDIIGNYRLSGFAPKNLQNLGIGGIVPVAYTINAETQLNFTGLGSQFFDFGSPIRFINQFIPTGANPTPLLTEGSFSLGFQVNDISDILGGQVVGINVSSTGNVALLPPIAITGLRSDFLEPPVPLLNQIQLDFVDILVHNADFLTEPIVLNRDITDGMMTINYDYTAPPASVPEPSTLLLLGTGLAALSFLRMRGSSDT